MDAVLRETHGAYIAPRSSDPAPTRSDSPHVPSQLQLSFQTPHLVTMSAEVPLVRSSLVESPATVAAIFDDEGRPRHAKYGFLDNSLVLYARTEIPVPPHIKMAAEHLVLALI